MSFRYKSALLSLASLAGIYGWYFASVIAARHGGDQGNPALRLVATIVLLAIVQIVGNIALAILSPDRAAALDERERAFDRRATEAGYYVLVAGALLACATIHIGAHAHDLANAVLLAVVVAECARQATFLILHHRVA